MDVLAIATVDGVVESICGRRFVSGAVDKIKKSLARDGSLKPLSAGDFLLILLLISGDLRLFQALGNAEVNFKSSRVSLFSFVENHLQYRDDAPQHRSQQLYPFFD